MTYPVPGNSVAKLSPVTAHERVQLLDVLRGFCLFGVLWSNLNDWYTTISPVTPLDFALSWTQDWLIESRLYSMLGFLFGIGFGIQLTRATQRGEDVRNLFLRRMSVLAGFGILHATLIWHGDILAAYAVVGFALVPFRRFSPRQLLVAAVLLSLVVPYIVMHGALLLNLPQYDAGWARLNDEALQIYAHGTWPEAVAQGGRQWWMSFERYLLYGWSSFLTLFVLGLWAVREDLVARLTRRRSYIVWALLGATICWIGFQYMELHLAGWWPPPGIACKPALRESCFWWQPRQIAVTLLDDAATWGNSAVYALVFALAMSFPAAARRLRPLGALGRMTVTTYLVQSIVCTALFYNWGVGLMSKVNLTGILVFTVSLFAMQIAFSVWWLKRYRFGPAEWLWRSLAYGRRLPLRI